MSCSPLVWFLVGRVRREEEGRRRRALYLLHTNFLPSSPLSHPASLETKLAHHMCISYHKKCSQSTQHPGYGSESPKMFVNKVSCIIKQAWRMGPTQHCVNSTIFVFAVWIWWYCCTILWPLTMSLTEGTISLLAEGWCSLLSGCSVVRAWRFSFSLPLFRGGAWTSGIIR